MALVVEEDEVLHSLKVGLFGADGIVIDPYYVPGAVEEFFLSHGSFPCRMGDRWSKNESQESEWAYYGSEVN